VHRDLKPDNVFLEQRGGREHVKVLDFGIAKPTHAVPAEELTVAGNTVGTVEYMSPEQLMGSSLDGRSDIYALGVIAYELLCGRHPFRAPPLEPGIVPAKLPNVPRAVERVVMRCLARRAQDRFPDVGTLAIALQVLLSSSRDVSDPDRTTRTIAAGSSPWPSAMRTVHDRVRK
jgi:eukaryotic-like serine/threonine-protein kinase